MTNKLDRLLELERYKNELGLEQWNHPIYDNQRAEYLSLKSKIQALIEDGEKWRKIIDTDIMIILHAMDILKERGQDTLPHIGFKLEVDRVHNKFKEIGKEFGVESTE